MSGGGIYRPFSEVARGDEFVCVRLADMKVLCDWLNKKVTRDNVDVGAAGAAGGNSDNKRIVIYEKLELDDNFNPVRLEEYKEPIVVVINYTHFCKLSSKFASIVKQQKPGRLNSITKIHCRSEAVPQLLEMLVSNCSYSAIKFVAWSESLKSRLFQIPKEQFLPEGHERSERPDFEPVEFTGKIIHQ